MRKKSFQPTEGKPQGGLKPWREVVTPHPDVASGRYQQAEFAADLWQVYQGEGSDEYKHPTEFFRRTFLTEGLRQLLSKQDWLDCPAQGGDPVVELQTNFGGGKTHSMLALYHLFSGTAAGELPGAEELVEGSRASPLPKKCPPGGFRRHADFAGQAAQETGRHDRPHPLGRDRLATWRQGGLQARQGRRRERPRTPATRSRRLFNKYGPCLILIDEWVAYARQLHTAADLARRHVRDALHLCPSIERSGQGRQEHAACGEHPGFGKPAPEGRARRDRHRSRRRTGSRRLWLDSKTPSAASKHPGDQPAPDEGFEIVRRRLFQPLTGDQFVTRDAVARAFVEFVRFAAAGVSARMPRSRLRTPDQNGLSDPSGDVRPALQRLVHARQVPANPRRVAADGRRDPFAVGTAGQQRAHHAGRMSPSTTRSCNSS